MNFKYQILIGISLIIVEMSYSLNESIFPDYIYEFDTLKVSYINKDIIGRQLYPLNLDSINELKFAENNLLLQFKTTKYNLFYYNKKSNLKFLNSNYWDSLILKYIKDVNCDTKNQNKFKVVFYEDPFLTGIYRGTDSIIAQKMVSSDINSMEKLSLKYFSTLDSVFKLTKNIYVGAHIKSFLNDLNIIDNLNNNINLEIVLMEATSQIDNAWYLKHEKSFSNYTIAVVLLIEDCKVKKIQFVDVEYIEFILNLKEVNTNTILHN